MMRLSELAGTRTQDPPDKNRDALPTGLSDLQDTD